MSKQILIPARSVEEAKEALPRIGDIAEGGDSVVLLIIAEIPERELVGSEPSPAAIEPLAHAGTGFSTPAPASDVPVFADSDELMDERAQEIQDQLADSVAALTDQGYDSRVQVVFSDSPDSTIRDAASDLGTSEVYVTSDFHSSLDEDVARVLP